MVEEIKPTGDGARLGENEMRMCGDCLGCGMLDKRPCVYCKGAGRVLTVRARMLREQRAERLANAAPALYEAARNALKSRIALLGSCEHESTVERCVECGLRAVIALVDGPQTTEWSE